MRNGIKDKGKRHVQHFIYGRTLIVLLFLAIQCFLLINMVFSLKEYSTALYAGMQLIAIITVIVIVNRKENPGFKLTWLVLIVFMPVFGAALYIFVQSELGTKVAAWRMRSLKEEYKAHLPQNEMTFSNLKKEHAALAGLSNYLQQTSGYPVYHNGTVTYFPSGEQMHQRLLEDLRQAQSYIFMEFFVIREGEMLDSILEILQEKAEAGVDVRIIYDGMCTFTDVPVSFPKKLRKKGIAAQVYGPIRPVLTTLQNNRDHRKIVVIDGSIAYTGGVNLADEYINAIERFGHWKDVAIRMTGEGVKAYITMFWTMWNATKREPEPVSELLEDLEYNENSLQKDIVIPTNSSAGLVSKEAGYVFPYQDCPFDDFYVGKHLYMELLNLATEYVYIMTPYLVLDNEMVEALTFAAMRGVDVRLILPHIPDKKMTFCLAKSYYAELLLGGVKIYEYLPGFVHAKMVICDDCYGLVGSTNMDYRSFYLHYECGAMLYQTPCLKQMKQDADETIAQCVEITMDLVKQEHFYVKLIGGILRLIAPLM